MSDCRSLTRFLDGSLAADERARFEAHLTTCAECSRAVRTWGAASQRLLAWGELDLPPPDDIAVQAMVRRAQVAAPPAPRLVGLWLWATALAATAACLLVLVPSVRRGFREQPLSLRVLTGPRAGELSTAGPGAMLAGVSGKPLLADLGGDLIGLSADAGIELAQASARHVVLRVRRGSVAFAVQHRGAGRLFEVDAGEARVHVVGTRLLVSVDGGNATVAVTEGRVQVDRPGRPTALVEAGHTLSADRAEAEPLPDATRTTVDRLLQASDASAALIPAPAAPLSPAISPPPATPTRTAPAPAVGPRHEESLETYRRWVVVGDYDRAEAGLAAHVRLKPHDMDAWSLLADCRRKAGRSAAAVAAYRVIIDGPDAEAASRARLLAATVLQEELGDPTGAVRLLRDYLAGPSSSAALRAHAEVRLARSLRALGELSEARAVLQGVLKHAGDTPAAIDARRLLEELP